MPRTVRPDLEDKLSCKTLSGASSPPWTVKAKGLLFLLRPKLLVLSHWPAFILFIYLFLSKTVRQIQVSFWWTSQNRHPVRERNVELGKRSLSFVSQVEPEVGDLCEGCPLLVLPGTSLVKRMMKLTFSLLIIFCAVLQSQCTVIKSFWIMYHILQEEVLVFLL